MFAPEIWQFFGLVVAPLLGVIVGGIIYWLKKLDDRQYTVATHSVTRSDLLESLRPINERLIRIENRLPNPPPTPTRWKNL